MIDLFYDELFCEDFSSGVVFVLGGNFFLEIILWDISSSGFCAWARKTWYLFSKLLYNPILKRIINDIVTTEKMLNPFINIFCLYFHRVSKIIHIYDSFELGVAIIFFSAMYVQWCITINKIHKSKMLWKKKGKFNPKNENIYLKKLEKQFTVKQYQKVAFPESSNIFFFFLSYFYFICFHFFVVFVVVFLCFMFLESY